MTREDAIMYLKRADTTVGQAIKTKTAEALEMAIKVLGQKPKTGKWRMYPVNCSNAFMCDSCHRLVVTPSDFCPNCGAKMEGATYNGTD